MRLIKAGLKVLLVEDEPEVRSVVRRHLQSLACVVEDFGSAEQALASLEMGADCELLITDVALGPGMRGTQLADQVEASFPFIRVLLMSGYSAETIEGESASGRELVGKPFDRSKLALAIGRVLAAPSR